MIIESKLFENWLKKASVNGKIDEIRLNFSEEGVSMIESDKGSFYLTKCLLKKKAFKNYESIGEIAVNNISRLINFLKRFSEEIEISKNNSILTIKGKTKKAEYILANLESMPDKKNFPKYDDWKVNIKLESSVLKDILEDANTIGKNTEIFFKTKEKGLLISCGKDDKFQQEIKNANIEEKDVKTFFGDPLKEVIAVLDDEINFQMGKASPIKIIEKNDLEEFIFFVAPKSEGDNK